MGMGFLFLWSKEQGVDFVRKCSCMHVQSLQHLHCFFKAQIEEQRPGCCLLLVFSPCAIACLCRTSSCQHVSARQGSKMPVAVKKQRPIPPGKDRLTIPGEHGVTLTWQKFCARAHSCPQGMMCSCRSPTHRSTSRLPRAWGCSPKSACVWRTAAWAWMQH